jgi:hypothetical protein
VIFDAGRRRSVYALVAAIPSFALPPRCVLLCFLLFVPFVQGATVKHRGCLEQFRPAALARVKTFCLDTSNLEPGFASEVAAFAAKRGHSHGVLKQMPWTFTDRCAAADAVIRIYFTGSEQLSYSGFAEAAGEAVLLVYDRASLTVLYRTEVRSRRNKTVVLSVHSLRLPITGMTRGAEARFWSAEYKRVSAVCHAEKTVFKSGQGSKSNPVRAVTTASLP